MLGTFAKLMDSFLIENISAEIKCLEISYLGFHSLLFTIKRIKAKWPILVMSPYKRQKVVE